MTELMNEIECQEDEVRIAEHNLWVAKTNVEDYQEQLNIAKRKLIKMWMNNMSEIKYLLGYDEIAFKGMTNILTQCPTKQESQELQNKIKSALKLQELVNEELQKQTNFREYDDVFNTLKNLIEKSK